MGAGELEAARAATEVALTLTRAGSVPEENARDLLRRIEAQEPTAPPP